MDLRLAHLNLAVADRASSIAFYRRWFGFERVLAEYDDGTTFVVDRSGFELALHEARGAVSATDWHFGFLASSAADVRRRLADLEAAGVIVYGGHDSPDYTGFKCRDPDGYEIEVYFEPRLPADVGDDAVGEARRAPDRVVGRDGRLA